MPRDDYYVCVGCDALVYADQDVSPGEGEGLCRGCYEIEAVAS